MKLGKHYCFVHWHFRVSYFAAEQFCSMQVYLTPVQNLRGQIGLKPRLLKTCFARDNGLDTVRNMKNLMLTQS